MGQPKAWLDLGGRSFVAHVVDRARRAGCDRVVVVVGPGGTEAWPETLGGSDLLVVVNPVPDRGQLASLKLAVEGAGDVSGLLAWPVDHPAVEVASVCRLLDAHGSSPDAIIVPTYGGRGGHPTLFPRSTFSELLGTDDHRGARAVVRREPGRVRRLELADPTIRWDVDTPEDLERLRNHWKDGAG
jgi:CTP:molybdopterin cytidylyltransferase MocA